MASSSVLGALFLIFGWCIELSFVVFCVDDVAALLQALMIACWVEIVVFGFDCLILIDWLIGELVFDDCGVLRLCSIHNTVHTDSSWRWGFALNCAWLCMCFFLFNIWIGCCWSEVLRWRCWVLGYCMVSLSFGTFDWWSRRVWGCRLCYGNWSSQTRMIM